MSQLFTVFFVCLQLSLGLSMILLTTQCPKVTLDPEADCDGEFCFDCAFSYGHMCCPNECGGFRCENVMKPCTYNGTFYLHHKNMPLPVDRANDRCGDCWCQNGEKQCIEYSCEHGPVP